MKKILLGIIALTITAITFTSCEKNEDDPIGNGEGKIISFSFDGITNATAIINAETSEVSVIVPEGTNLTSLTPIVEVSPGASITPNTGVAQDFTQPVTYTVKASDNQTYTWKVYVYAGGGGEIVIVNSNISTATTWISSKTYIVDGDVSIDADLTIQPGTWVRFKAGAKLSVGYYNAGTIIANGTADKPITFTSTLANPTPGAWEGIYLYSNNSSNSSFRYCQFSYAGTDDRGALTIDGTSCTFSNNIIKYAKKIGIICYNVNSYFVEMSNNTISDCGSHAVKISAAKLHTIGAGNALTCSNGFGVNVYSSDATGTVSWKKLTVPYYVEGEVNVDGNLTIEPGTIFKFNVEGSLCVGYYNSATLTANGTSTDKIVFTSSAATPAAGAWHGIYFYSYNQSNSSMTNCEVAYAGKADNRAIAIMGTGLTFNSNNVHHSNNLGIDLDGDAYFVAMNNNTISDCANHAVSISGDYFHTIGTNNTITCSNGKGIFLTGGKTASTVTWRKQTVPVYINSEVGIESTVTIEAGSVFKFGAEGSIYVGYYGTSQLNAIGTQANPIIFTGSSDSPAAGAWYGIKFYNSTSPNTTLDYCEFNYAGKGTADDRAAAYIDGIAGLTIKNCKFTNSSGWGIYKNNSSLSASSLNNTFSSCALGNIGTN